MKLRLFFPKICNLTPPPTIRHKRVICIYKPPQSYDKMFIERLPNQLNDLYTSYDALLLRDFKMIPEDLKLNFYYWYIEFTCPSIIKITNTCSSLKRFFRELSCSDKKTSMFWCESVFFHCAIVLVTIWCLGHKDQYPPKQYGYF